MKLQQSHLLSLLNSTQTLKVFVRPYEYEIISFILFLKGKFRTCELPYESTT